MSLSVISQLIHILLDSSSGFNTTNFSRDLESLFCRKVFAPPSTLSSSYENSRICGQRRQHVHFTHCVIVTGAGFKSPIGRGLEGP